MISGVTDCNMKCPYCEEENIPFVRGKYRCSGCGYSFTELPDKKINFSQDSVKPDKSAIFFICVVCCIVFANLSVGIPSHFGNPHGPTATETFRFPLRSGAVYVNPIVGIVCILFWVFAISASAVGLLGHGITMISKEFEKNGITVGVILGILWLIFGFCCFVVMIFAPLSDVISQQTHKP